MVDLLQHSYQKKQKSSSIPNRTFVSKSSSILKTLGRWRNDFYQKIYRFFLLYLRLVTRLLRLLRFRLCFRFVCLRLPPCLIAATPPEAGPAPKTTDPNSMDGIAPIGTLTCNNGVAFSGNDATEAWLSGESLG